MTKIVYRVASGSPIDHDTLDDAVATARGLREQGVSATVSEMIRDGTHLSKQQVWPETLPAQIQHTDRDPQWAD